MNIILLQKEHNRHHKYVNTGNNNIHIDKDNNNQILIIIIKR